MDLYSEWLSLQPLLPEVKKRLDDKFRLEFNYNSNHLEGNTLTYGETKLLLLFEQTSGSHELREYEEMKAHDVALELIKREAADSERPLTENFIRELNGIILVRPFYKDAITADGQETRRLIKVGGYKEHPNSVQTESGELFEYASPQEVPALMSDLVAWYNDEAAKGELSPIQLASLLHYRYIRIHPFDDGNGRIARLLVNYVLFRHQYPPIIIKTADKKNYLRALRQADAGDLDAFIHYMEEQLHWSLDLAVRAAKGDTIDEEDDWKKKVALLKQQNRKPTNIEVKKSDEAIERVARESIVPLLKVWNGMIKEIEPLFAASEVRCGNFLSDQKIEINTSDEDLLSKILSKSRNDSLELHCKFYKYMHAIDEDTDGGSIKVVFDTNQYSVEASINIKDKDPRVNLLIPKISLKKIIKPYNQQLTKEEIDSIINSIGNKVFEDIESMNPNSIS